MNKLKIIRIIILAASFVAALCWLSWRKDATKDAPPTPSERVERSLRQLKTSDSKTASQASLRELRGALRQMSTQEAVAWILRELDEAGDFPTQLDFTIGTDQNLTGWPSYRVFLLDLLFLTDAAAAAEKSRGLVESSRSPDEWAVALRNVAKSDTRGGETEWLRARSAELLQNEEWRKNPSDGYLHAFDVIVHSRHTALAPELLLLCDDHDQKAVRHAAFLALDRLVQVEPGDVLQKLAAEASSHPQSGLMLSNMMARGDVRDPAQRQALESYLLNPGRTQEELRGFASVFPNASFAVSTNLLTRVAAVKQVDLALQDRVTLEVVASWLGDERFSSAHAPLREVYQRVRSFVEKK